MPQFQTGNLSLLLLFGIV